MKSCQFLLFNVFLPCDDRANFNEYMYVVVLEDILMKCNDHSCKNVIMASDLNTRFD